MNTVFIAFTLKNSSVSEFFVSLANHLSKTHQVIIITHANEDHPFLLEETVEVWQWPTKRPKTIKDFYFIIKLIKEYQPGTIIANFAAVNLFLLAGFIMKVKNRIAWYHTLTTQLEDKPFLRYRKIFFYWLSTKIVANSEAGKQDLVKSFKIKASKIEVVHNAVEDPMVKTKTEVNKIVFAGRLFEVKGAHILLKAVPLIKKEIKNFKVEIIGDDEETGELKRLIELRKDLCIEDQVSFLGNRSRDYVLQKFSTAYVTVVPSFFEAFGYVVIESFSVRTPVIGSNTTGISTIIRDGEDGFLFKAGDYTDLAEKIIYLFKNRDIRKSMSVNCYNHFLEKYELKKQIKEFARNPEIFN